MNKEELFYSETMRRTQEQCAARQHFDTMSVTILSVGAIVLSAMVVTLPHWSCWSIVPASLLIISFCILAIYAIIGLWQREWDFQPNLSDLDSNVDSNYQNTELIKWAAHWMAQAISDNKKWLVIKAKCLRVSYIALAIQALALGILIVSIYM